MKLSLFLLPFILGISNIEMWMFPKVTGYIKMKYIKRNYICKKDPQKLDKFYVM